MARVVAGAVEAVQPGQQYSIDRRQADDAEDDEQHQRPTHSGNDDAQRRPGRGRIAYGTARRLPAEPPSDSHGLRTQIVR